MIQYLVYVLYSPSAGRFYHGRCSNMASRLKDHNAGKVKSTKYGVPWTVVYREEYSSLEESVEREKYFKTAAGRRFLDPIKKKYKP